MCQIPSNEGPGPGHPAGAGELANVCRRTSLALARDWASVAPDGRQRRCYGLGQTQTQSRPRTMKDSDAKCQLLPRACRQSCQLLSLFRTGLVNCQVIYGTKQETTGASPHAWSSSAVAPANRQLSMGLGSEEGHSVLVTSCVSRASNKLGLCSAPTHGKGEIGARLEVGRLDDAGCQGVQVSSRRGHCRDTGRRSRGRRKREQLDCFLCQRESSELTGSGSHRLPLATGWMGRAILTCPGRRWPPAGLSQHIYLPVRNALQARGHITGWEPGGEGLLVNG